MAIDDYLVRGLLGNEQARVFALRTTKVVQEAQNRHKTSPTASAALGRTLTMGLVLGAMLKGEETVTIQIKGDGPLQGIVVSANAKGEVKGYVGNPRVNLPLNSSGKLAVGEAVGAGNLHVIRDLGLKDTYQGTVPLQTGEIGVDFAYYFNHSEQTPAAVAVGVLVGTDGIPLGAGGVVVQLLPGASSDGAFVSQLEQHLAKISSVSTLFAEKQAPEAILHDFLGDLGLTIIGKTPIRFHCDCSRSRFARGLVALGSEEMQELIDLGQPVETVCRFCGQSYSFSPQDLKTIRLQSKA